MIRFGLFALLLSSMAVAVGSDSAYANSQRICDSLLSGTAQSTLSPAAQSYVNLVVLYTKQKGQLPVGLSNKILSSNTFVNPFADQTDTQSLLFSKAFQKIKQQLTQQDWQEIKAAVKKLANKSKARAQDQEQKEDETSEVFAPKIVDEVEILGFNVTPAPKLQVINGRAYVALLSFGQGIILYEIVNGKFVLQKSENVIQGTSSPEWLQVDGRTFLATTTKVDNFIIVYIYELINGQLKLIAEKKMVELDFIQKLSWLTTDGRILLSGGSLNGGVFVTELVNDQLNVLGVKYAENPVRAKPSWQVVNGQIFLAVGSDDFRVYLFEVEGKSVGDRGFIRTQGTVRTAPVWHTVDDRTFVTFGSDDTLMYLAELVNDQLEFVNILQAEKAVYTTSATQIINGQHFGLYGSIDNKVYLYEIVNGELVLKISEDVGAPVAATSAWQSVNDRLLLAVPLQNSSVDFYEWMGDRLIFVSRLKTHGAVRSAPQWYFDGQETYLVVHSTDKRNALQLVKIINKMTKSSNKGAN